MRDPELKSLRSLIEFASGRVDTLWRKQNGVIYPLYHAIKADGQHLILNRPDADKDMSVAMVMAAFVLNDVDRYVFFDEAWMLDLRGVKGDELEQIEREGLRKHPDRREMVMFSAENRRGEMMTGRRFILRPEHGKAKLTPLEIEDMTDSGSEGRMVGLLQREK